MAARSARPSAALAVRARARIDGARKLAALAALIVPLAACNEDGSAQDSVVETQTLRPTAALSASPLTGDWPLTVTFDGSGSSDPDGTIARYEWSFGDGGRASGATASHTYREPGTFLARLLVTDDQGATGSTTRSIVVTGPVTLSGRVTYDRVPFGATGTGLDYTRTTRPPARGIVVELLDAGGSVLATTSTTSDGRYSFDVNENTDVKLRARAHLLEASTGAGDPGWDVEVLDNTNAAAPWVFEGPLQNSG
ncbi:PKD domain-containing protein, partial [Myxococcota bacterium]|nr:PKD domain-containing protein [Myxococcota bacterium]